MQVCWLLVCCAVCVMACREARLCTHPAVSPQHWAVNITARADDIREVALAIGLPHAHVVRVARDASAMYATGVACEIAICAAAYRVNHTSHARLFVLSSRASIDTRLLPMLQTWIPAARRAGLQITVYATADSAPFIEQRTREKVLAFPVRDEYPPFDIHAELLAHIAHWSVADPTTGWYMHVDDDAYVDVVALLRFLSYADATVPALYGVPKDNEPASVLVYCIGFAVAISRALGAALYADGLDLAYAYHLLHVYRAIRATHIISDDVYAWGFVPDRLLGIQCTIPPGVDRMGVHEDPGSSRHATMRVDSNHRTVAYHKVTGKDIVRLSAGRRQG